MGKWKEIYFYIEVNGFWMFVLIKEIKVKDDFFKLIELKISGWDIVNGGD